MGAKSSSTISGFRYYLTILMGLCRGPIDELLQISCGGYIAWDGEGLGGSTGTVKDTESGVILSRPDLFGGDSSQGGLDGFFSVYMGKADQQPPADFQDEFPGPVPGMRGVAAIMWKGQVSANNPNPNQFKFRIRRSQKGWAGDRTWYPEQAAIFMTDPAIGTYTTISNVDGSVATITQSDGTQTTQYTDAGGARTYSTYNAFSGTQTGTTVPLSYNIIKAMNPAHIIFECCTNPDWGRGLDWDLMDQISFTSAANQLVSEKFGLCLKWSRAEDIDVFVQTILDHIGGVLYTDRVTGLQCLRLIRDDYDESSLTVFDQTSGLLEVTTTAIGASDAVANEVIVVYHSPVLDNDQQARAQNPGSINSLGSVYSVTKQYPGIPTADLAVIVAQRDLRAGGSGMRKITMKMDRRGYTLVPGDVIKINVPDKNLNMLTVRIAQMSDSGITDGSITVTAVQDVFGLPTKPFIAPQQSTFLEPNLYPMPILVEQYMEASYRDVYKFGGEAVAATVNDQTDAAGDQGYGGGSGYTVLMAQAPTTVSYGFEQYVDNGHGAGFAKVGTGNFVKVSQTVNDIGIEDTSFQIKGDIKPGSVAVGDALSLTAGGRRFDSGLYEEIVVVRAVTQAASGVITLKVGRGCVDSPAQSWPANTYVYARDQAGVVDKTEYLAHESLVARALTMTSRGTQALSQGLGNEQWCYMQGRAFAPYMCSNVTVNGVRRGAIVKAVGPDIAIAWSHRNRLTQADQLIDDTQADVPPEDGTVYSLELDQRDPVTGVLSAYRLVFSTEDNHYTFTAAMLADTGSTGVFVNGPVTCQLRTSRGAVGAQRAIEMTFNYISTADGTVPDPPPLPSSGWGSAWGLHFGE